MEFVQGFDPRTGQPVGEPVPVTSETDVDRTALAAAEAFEAWDALGPRGRADVLDRTADALDAAADDLVRTADAETALGETRLRGEVARTTGQLRLFGQVLREGSYLEAILDPPSLTPPRPDVRRMLQPIGPVAVFSASNFPFAFSVAGGDTASALAAGCPVVVKAHEGHPGTSRRTFEVVAGALRAAGAPGGVFGIVYGVEAGKRLVQHPQIRAVGFTGSARGGRALFDLCAARPDPIPFYGELGSVNPVVVLPGAAREKAGEIASGFAGSLTLGVGQFCTNPGLLFVPEDAEELLAALAEAVAGTGGGAMLSERIRAGYTSRVEVFDRHPALTLVAAGRPGDAAWSATPRLYRTSLKEFAEHLDQLAEECFGPAGVVVTYGDLDALLDVLPRLGGNLTGSVHATAADAGPARRLADRLRRQVGRVVYNGWPTGVAVCWAMHHGGPWPASTAAAHTSVGATAIRRWLIPVAYQNWPDELLPPALQDGNPLGIPRRENGALRV